MIIAIITAYSAADDPESAFKIMKEKCLLGFRPDLNVYQTMIRAFAVAGNYEGAESVIAHYDHTGDKAGKGNEFSISLDPYAECLEITPNQLLSIGSHLNTSINSHHCIIVLCNVRLPATFRGCTCVQQLRRCCRS